MKVESVEVSLQARSKSGRYYGEAAIQEKLSRLDGQLFRRDETYYLLTSKTLTGGNIEKIVIVFKIEERTAQVITQTSDHYNWGDFRQVQNPDLTFETEPQT